MLVDLLFTFVDLIINKGIPLFSVIYLLFYKMPSIMVLTFPVATLFGVAMAMGRLSKDNELTALRTSGISFARIAFPIIIISILVSMVSFITNEKIVPYASHQSDKIIREIIYRQPIAEVKENVFFKDPYNRYFYVQKLNNKEKTLENIMVYELTGDKIPRITTAKTAKLEGAILILYSGQINKFDNNGQLTYSATFETIKLDLAENSINFSDQKTTEEMNSSELMKEITNLEKSGVNTKALRTDYLMKFSIPLTSFVFAIIGIPLSIPGLRGSKTWGMILTIIIMFTFYVFASVFRSLGRAGILLPIFAAWTPQALFGILGIILLYIETRHK